MAIIPAGNSHSVAGELSGAVTRFVRRLRRERPEYRGEYIDLSLSHFSALGSLEKAGAMTPRDLAACERVQPPSMTRIVAKLELAGLVERVAHPTDGRQVILSLSEAGRNLLRENRRLREAWLARQLDGLTTAERATLKSAAELLDRMASS